MKIINFSSPRSGKAVANQFLIVDNKNNIEIFQSYNSIIAKKENGKVFLDDKYWEYSKTTSKYRNEFLGESTAETREKINSGEYILCDLNN